jgi:hypothetical protein
VPLDVMNLGEFEPDVWIPASHPAARRETISLGELARMDVIDGPPRGGAAIYGAWLAVLRTMDPRFEFTDPPFRNSLPITLAFDMVPVRLDQSPLAATAGLVWSGHLPRLLQQVLFDAANGIIL